MSSEIVRYINKKDAELLHEIELAANQSDHDTALRLTEDRLAKPIDLSRPSERLLKGSLAGWLIDIGTESGQEQIVKKGLSILENEEAVLRKNVTQASYDYNIGNAYSSLFDLKKSKPGFKLNPSEIQDIVKSKSRYWRAYKSLQTHDRAFWAKLWVNLGNCLLKCNRVVEAIIYYDDVITEYPKFPQANASRADALLKLNEISDTYSINLLAQAIEGYSVASDFADTLYNRQAWHMRSELLKQKLLEHGYDSKNIEHETSETESEHNQHSKYRKFCLEQHLSLSEHSIYCGCAGARSDDLTVPKSSGPIGGNFVPRMEFILNRVKSEFTFARLMYYQAVLPLESEWDLLEDEIRITQLFEDEMHGPRSEMLRLSFRNCFAILDKIAMAICELFELAQPKEVLYFESFWRSRWERINQIDNPAIVALYALATDLNSKTGDWPEFKEWRNAIEHRIFCVLQKENFHSDPYSVVNQNAGDLVVPLDVFHQRALFLLRLTRSAIFSFVFCVRYEGSKLTEGDPSKAITLRGRNEESG
ncbi:MAG: LA2681 family HEPN domain-containing protein [Deltaproteobacteria bacterium]